jgi:hypothetical protein
MPERLAPPHTKHGSRRTTAKQSRPLIIAALSDHATETANLSITTIVPEDIFGVLGAHTQTYRMPHGSCSCEDIDTDFSPGPLLEKLDALSLFNIDQVRALKEQQARILAEVTDADPEIYIRGYSLYATFMARRKETVFTQWPVPALNMFLGRQDRQDPYSLARAVTAHVASTQPYIQDCVGTHIGNVLCGLNDSRSTEIFSTVNSRRMLALGIGMASIQLEQFYYESMGDDMRSLVPTV